MYVPGRGRTAASLVAQVSSVIFFDEVEVGDSDVKEVREGFFEG